MRKALITGAVVILLGASTGQLSSQPAPPQALATYRGFWNATLGDLAMVWVCTDTAAMAAVDGDLVRAARVLAYGQKSTDSATNALAHGIPTDWYGSIGVPLSQAAHALSGADGNLRAYLAHGKIADLKAAQSGQAQASAELAAITADARASYAGMGGNANDLVTLSQAIQSANTALASAMGDTDTDDSDQ